MARRQFILIDGPSGAGKTTYAEKLAGRTGFPVVHLEDFYPGWSGLAQASRMVVTDVLDETAPGFRRWDWIADRRAEWVELDPTASYIIEGVGAITRESVAAAGRLGEVCTVRITAAEEKRRERALRRDPFYGPWWRMWAEQEATHFAGPGRVPVDHAIRW